MRSRNPTKRQGQVDSPAPSPTPEPVEPTNEDLPADLEAQPQKESLPQQNVITDVPTSTINPQKSQQLYLVDGWNMSASEEDSALPTMNWTPDSELPNTLFGTGPEPIKPHDHSSAWSFGALELTFPLDYRFAISQPTTMVTVTSPTVFVETILQACRKYVSMHASESEDDPTLCSDLAPGDWSQEAHIMNTIARISEISVHMLAAFAGLETYVYGVVCTLLGPFELSCSL